MTDQVSAETIPDIGQMENESEEHLQDRARHLLESAALYLKASTTKFTDVISTMSHIVSATATFRNDIKGALEARHITLDAFTKELEGIFSTIGKNLAKIPPSNAPGHAERGEMVDRILEDTSQALRELVTRYGIDERIITAYLGALKVPVSALIVTIGDIAERYPQLLPTLMISVTILLVPELWFLQPFLSMFGFGPLGPVKGSVAAWLQMRFWGATVAAGSWFSVLQAAGMGVLPAYAGFVIKAPLLMTSGIRGSTRRPKPVELTQDQAEPTQLAGWKSRL